VYERVLTVHQLARTAVYSFPMVPDVYALVTLAANKHAAEQGPAQPVFGAGSAAPSSSSSGSK